MGQAVPPQPLPCIWTELIVHWLCRFVSKDVSAYDSGPGYRPPAVNRTASPTESWDRPPPQTGIAADNWGEPSSATGPAHDAWGPTDERQPAAHNSFNEVRSLPAALLH